MTCREEKLTQCQHWGYEGKFWRGADIRVRARPERYGELVLDAVLPEECKDISVCFRLLGW